MHICLDIRHIDVDCPYARSPICYRSNLSSSCYSLMMIEVDKFDKLGVCLVCSQTTMLSLLPPPPPQAEQQAYGSSRACELHLTRQVVVVVIASSTSQASRAATVVAFGLPTPRGKNTRGNQLYAHVGRLGNNLRYANLREGN